MSLSNVCVLTVYLVRNKPPYSAGSAFSQAPVTVEPSFYRKIKREPTTRALPPSYTMRFLMIASGAGFASVPSCTEIV